MPTENELNGISEGSLSHNVISGLFLSFVFKFYLFLFFLLSYWYFAYGFQVYVSMEFLSLHTSVSLHLYLVFVHFLGLFSFCFLVLSYSNLFLLALYYYILSYYYPLDACLFLRQKGGGFRWDRKWGVGGGKIIIRIYCMKKHQVSTF